MGKWGHSNTGNIEQKQTCNKTYNFETKVLGVGCMRSTCPLCPLCPLCPFCSCPFCPFYPCPFCQCPFCPCPFMDFAKFRTKRTVSPPLPITLSLVSSYYNLHVLWTISDPPRPNFILPIWISDWPLHIIFHNYYLFPNTYNSPIWPSLAQQAKHISLGRGPGTQPPLVSR